MVCGAPAPLWLVRAIVAMVVAVSMSLEKVHHGAVEVVASFYSSWSGSPPFNVNRVAAWSHEVSRCLGPYPRSKLVRHKALGESLIR